MAERTRPIVPCQRCRSPLEPDDLRCAVCALPVPLPALSVVREELARVVRCGECGAAVTYDVKRRAPTCAFCGAMAHIETRRDPLECADAYLPFQVDEAEARAALRAWLRGLSFFRPPDLAASAVLDDLQPLYWVGWTFDVEALVSYTADTSHGARRSEWAPHSGQRSATMRDVLVSASRGLSADEAARLFPHFDLTSGRPEPDAPDPAAPGSEVIVEHFDVQRSTAREIITDAVHENARQLARHWVPGGRVRKLRVAVLAKKLYTRRFGFPTYVLAYRYRGKPYRALIHGQSADRVVGRAPWSLVRLAIPAVAALIAALIAWWFLS